MTTTSRPPAAPAVAAPPEPSPAARRYVDGIVRLHAQLNWKGLPDAVDGDPLLVFDSYGDGLLTLSVRQSQLPERYLRGVLGFRMAQFLQLGLMDPELVRQRSLWHEAIAGSPGPEPIHTLTLDERGKLVGYLGYVGSPDPVPLALDAPDRGRFPAEEAHDVDLLARYAAPGRDTHAVWEIKRFVRDRAMPRGPQRSRVPWHLIAAIAKIAIEHDFVVVLGDSGEKGALRHLRLMGLDIAVVEDTQPSLPRSELMWPSYLVPAEDRAKPFVAPIEPLLTACFEVVDASLLLDRDSDWQAKAIERLVEVHRAAGTLERLAGSMT
jgi:hypothetical protein